MDTVRQQIPGAADGRGGGAGPWVLAGLALLSACSGPRPIRLPAASTWSPAPAALASGSPAGEGAAAGESISPAPLGGAAAGGGVVVIDLAQALALAAESDLEIRIAVERAQEAFAEADLVAESLYPSLSLGLRRGHRDGSFQTTAGSFLEVDARQVFRGPSVELSFDPGRAVFTRAAARERAEGRTFGAMTAFQGAMLRAGLGFVDLQEAHALLAVASQALERAEELVGDQRSRRTAGAGHEGDLQEALAQRSRALDRLLSRKAQAQTASARLAEGLGLDPQGTLVPRGGELTALEMVALDDLSHLTELALERRSEVAEARSGLRAAERERTLQTWRWAIPTLEGVAEAGEVGADDDDLEHTQAYSVALQWDLGATLSGELHRSSAREREAGFVLEAVRRRVAREVAEAYGESGAVRERCAVLAEAERSAGAALEQAALRFANSDRLLMELQRADSLLTALQERRVGALAEYCRSQLVLFAAVGGGGDGDLSTLLPDAGPVRGR